MNAVMLRSEDIFDYIIEGNYAYIKSVKDTLGVHYHNFFEFFAVLKGRVIHWVNSKRQCLAEDSLVFIRPGDTHFYEKEDGCDCHILNMAFSYKTVKELFGYLGSGFLPDRLLRPEIPPTVLLSEHERNYILSRFEKLNLFSLSNKEQIKTEMRLLLIELFTRYFAVSASAQENILPYWLDSLYKDMQKKDNFIAGLQRLYELGGKTPEHISRMFKKYFKLTPTEFINDLRLNYAANLLMNTDESILSICFGSGFENTSHFYHLFRMKYTMSPMEFRKSRRMKII